MQLFVSWVALATDVPPNLATMSPDGADLICHGGQCVPLQTRHLDKTSPFASVDTLMIFLVCALRAPGTDVRKFCRTHISDRGSTADLNIPGTVSEILKISSNQRQRVAHSHRLHKPLAFAVLSTAFVIRDAMSSLSLGSPCIHEHKECQGEGAQGAPRPRIAKIM